MTKQDSGFKGRMDDCLFTIVEEPSSSSTMKKTSVEPKSEPPSTGKRSLKS